jgi:hypothetical protein
MWIRLSDYQILQDRFTYRFVLTVKASTSDFASCFTRFAMLFMYERSICLRTTYRRWTDLEPGAQVEHRQESHAIWFCGIKRVVLTYVRYIHTLHFETFFSTGDRGEHNDSERWNKPGVMWSSDRAPTVESRELIPRNHMFHSNMYMLNN